MDVSISLNHLKPKKNSHAQIQETKLPGRNKNIEGRHFCCVPKVNYFVTTLIVV